MIIWSYLMIIWWLFVIVWWLFDHNYSLFEDYSISAPAAGCLVCFISKSLRMEQWIIWVMAAFPLGLLQPASLACYLLQKLCFICNNNLVFHGCFDEPSALPHSARSILLQEVVDPAITQNPSLTVSYTQITNLFCDGVVFFHPCVLRDTILDSNLK